MSFDGAAKYTLRCYRRFQVLSFGRTNFSGHTIQHQSYWISEWLGGVSIAPRSFAEPGKYGTSKSEAEFWARALSLPASECEAETRSASVKVCRFQAKNWGVTERNRPFEKNVSTKGCVIAELQLQSMKRSQLQLPVSFGQKKVGSLRECEPVIRTGTVCCTPSAWIAAFHTTNISMRTALKRLCSRERIRCASMQMRYAYSTSCVVKHWITQALWRASHYSVSDSPLQSKPCKPYELRFSNSILR